MKIAAVICECNPFHKGHAYVLEKAREKAGDEGAVVAVMSGDFVQRGEPAIYPKGERAKAVLSSGADLVLELPFPWSCSGAPDFARGGVSIARAIGADALVFGSESADTKRLIRTAKNLSLPEFETALSTAVNEDKGGQYARQREIVYSQLFGEELFVTPNDILALEYIKELIGSSVEPYPVKRIDTPSASDTRKMIYEGGYSYVRSNTTESASSVFSALEPYDRSLFSAAALAILRLSEKDASGIYGAPHSLIHRIISSAKRADSLDNMILLSATKKYTNAAIRRAIIHFAVGTKMSDVKSTPLFTRLLGANARGREVLSGADIPVITRASDEHMLSEDVKAQLALAKRAELLYRIGDKNKKIAVPFILDK